MGGGGAPLVQPSPSISVLHYYIRVGVPSMTADRGTSGSKGTRTGERQAKGRGEASHGATTLKAVNNTTTTSPPAAAETRRRERERERIKRKRGHRPLFLIFGEPTQPTSHRTDGRKNASKQADRRSDGRNAMPGATKDSACVQTGTRSKPAPRQQKRENREKRPTSAHASHGGTTTTKTNYAISFPSVNFKRQGSKDRCPVIRARAGCAFALVFFLSFFSFRAPRHFVFDLLLSASSKRCQ